MPAKAKARKTGRKTVRRTRKRGGSLFSWIKNSAIPWIRNKALPYLRKTKLISKAGKALGSVLPGQYGLAASSVGTVADKLGYGRKKTGGSIIDVARKAYHLGLKAKQVHDKVKSGRFISRGLLLGHKISGNKDLLKHGETAQKYGYGIGYQRGGALGYRPSFKKA